MGKQWQDSDGNGIFARKLTLEGYPIGDEFQINSYFLGNQDHFDVDVSADAGIIVT